MKNKNSLDKKIIDRVYQYEKKRTLLTVFKYFFFITIFLIFLIILLTIIYNTLKEQETLDLFDIFQENYVVIKSYIWDVLQLVYEESPKFLIVLTLSFFVLLLLMLFLLKKNFNKIRNRIKSIKNRS